MRDELRKFQLASRDFQPLEQDLRQALSAEPLSYPLELQLVEVLAAQSDWPQAEASANEYATRLTNEGGPVASKMASDAFSMLLLYQQGKFEELLTQAPTVQAHAAATFGRFYANLELGRLDEAERAMAEGGSKDPITMLGLSVAWREKGNQAKAAHWQSAAIEALQPYQEGRHMAELLADGPKADWSKVQRTALDAGPKALVCVALAQQCPEHRVQLATLADRLSFQPTYGQHLVKRVAAALLQPAAAEKPADAAK
jgi:hypothetical protein